MPIDINWTVLAFGFAVVSNLVSAGTWIFVYVGRKHTATDDQVKEVANRLTVVETSLATLPTAQNWGDLREGIADIRGDVRASTAEIRGLGAGLKRVETQIGLLMENELKGQAG